MKTNKEIKITKEIIEKAVDGANKDQRELVERVEVTEELDIKKETLNFIKKNQETFDELAKS